jgi:hypothetical protein
LLFSQRSPRKYDAYCTYRFAVGKPVECVNSVKKV